MKPDGYIVQMGAEKLIIDVEKKRKFITDEIVASLIAERKRRGLTQQDIADICIDLIDAEVTLSFILERELGMHSLSFLYLAE